MRIWVAVALSFLVAGLIAAGLGLAYVYSGEYNVAAVDPHARLSQWLLQTTKVQSIRSHAEEVAITLPTDSAALWRGFQAFDAMCVMCHGAPGVERGWLGKGMNPEPPALAEAAEAYGPEEVYWIVANGIKMAGMPALKPTHREDEILEVVAFVEQLPDISAQEYQAMRARTAASSAGEQAPAAHGHTHEDGHTH